MKLKIKVNKSKLKEKSLPTEKEIRDWLFCAHMEWLEKRTNYVNILDHYSEAIFKRLKEGN